MYDKKDENFCQAKTFTGIQDIFGPIPFQNVLYRNPNASADTMIGDYSTKPTKKDCKQEQEIPYVTCEKFHGLNKDLSCRSFRSTSTIFYDLDDIAKRHSYHGISVSTSNTNNGCNNILKAMKLSTACGFKGIANTIVQECTTIQPAVIKAKDSMECNLKKIKQRFPHNDILSSEIFLRDKRIKKRMRKNLYYNTDVMNQKFWSYAKYHTEYTKPKSEKKCKKKESKGKRTEDPCPCQLFSYACPCTDEKSLTELAKSSKCKSGVDKIISAAIVMQDTRKRQQKYDPPKEDKDTVVTNAELDDLAQGPTKRDTSSYTETFSRNSDKVTKPKKLHKIICPHCKENVEAISITEDESVKGESPYASKELPSTAAYNCSASFRSNRQRTGDADVCMHEPRCELVPVCQILPNENYDNLRGVKRRPSSRSIPKVIKITKACRHHPPCTVVPSCQRANVLRNKCEFIPPCLHRPRCVNLPLCVPIPRNINYNELMGKYVEEDCAECHHIPRCKLVAMCEESSSKNADCNVNSLEPDSCQYDKNTFPYIISPNNTFVPRTRSPNIISTVRPTPCYVASNKSCQFNCYQCKLDSVTAQGNTDTTGVIYIRDVGCQFHNMQHSAIDNLLQYKTSSTSLDNSDNKGDAYYGNVHTLRYEDKSTNVVFEQDPISTDSVLSGEIDTNCPSHGRGYTTQKQDFGFQPKSAYMAAYAQMTVASSGNTEASEAKFTMSKRRDTYPVKSRRSFFRGKCRKFFSSNKKGSSLATK